MNYSQTPPILQNTLSHWRERAGQHEILGKALALLPPMFAQELPRVIACSEFVGAAVLQDPGTLDWVVHHDSSQAVLLSYDCLLYTSDAADE